jgi:hypothetical protein
MSKNSAKPANQPAAIYLLCETAKSSIRVRLYLITNRPPKPKAVALTYTENVRSGPEFILSYDGGTASRRLLVDCTLLMPQNRWLTGFRQQAWKQRRTAKFRSSPLRSAELFVSGGNTVKSGSVAHGND